MSDFLSQEEIDALLSGNLADDQIEDKTSVSSRTLLGDSEKDALGEIGNISMGSAATALSQILNKRVAITTPDIQITTWAELIAGFQIPYVLVDVNYTDWLDGANLLIIKVSDAVIMADLMMGGTGEDVEPELDEIKTSAVAEVMNQMIGSAATAMSTMFQRQIKIAPPQLAMINRGEEAFAPPWEPDQPLVVVKFRMEIENLIDSQIMQVMPVENAKAEVDMLLDPPSQQAITATEEEVAATITAAAPVEEEPDEPATTAVAEELDKQPATTQRVYGNENSNIELILDVPLDIEVILGTANKRLQDILSLVPGAIVELERLVEEPVDITVNGTPIAKGEVVVVNESFGVRITHILEPCERINQLRHSS
ncbi:MAG: flagellar motor switch phosphatase FliY [Clostridia bacterium]|nr:flagellar motor switch phosphatase FliY [Clostridia bacterium]